MDDRPIILFDGMCNLCVGSVRFVLRHDRGGRFRFASLQSEAGRAIVEGHRVESDVPDAMGLVDGERVCWKSDAALRIAKRLGWPWRVFAVFLIVPQFVRDGVYDFIAARRYRWFGKRETCMVATEDVRARFLE
jgi:predicted DCC family thiol-disulfide oxidoreductase YuxK